MLFQFSLDINESNHMLTVRHILSVFSSIPSYCCSLISHLSTVPVFSSPVLSAKGHAGPLSRVHTFSREINGLSLQLLPLSFFVICQHWLGWCVQKGKRTLGHVWRLETDGNPLVLMNSGIGGHFLVSAVFIINNRTQKWAGGTDGAFCFCVCKYYNIKFMCERDWVCTRITGKVILFDLM